MKDTAFETLLELAIKEDLGDRGDVTSRSIFSGESSRAALMSKDSGILCGSEYFVAVMKRVDPETRVEFLVAEGSTLSQGEKVATVEGRTVSILEAERIAINFLALLSGIATRAAGFVGIAGSNTTILDTRKTLPGYRELSKYAVRVGGARNHRMGLFDMVLIKDNHIDAAGGIGLAVERVRKSYGPEFRVEVETRSLAEVREAILAGVDIVMLDNMNPVEAAKAVKLGRLESSAVKFEASGNFNGEKIRSYAKTGVDYISIGSELTLSVRAFDYSLQIEGKGK